MMDNLIIRKVTMADMQGLSDLYTGYSAYSNTLQLPDPTAELWEKRFSSMPDGVYAYVAERNGEIVGNLGFELENNVRRRHIAHFGMAVKDNHQGNGIGSALIEKALDLADNWLNLKRIELTVYTDNDAAIHLYKKFGFVIEGEAKAYAFRDGKYVDAYYMARVR